MAGSVWGEGAVRRNGGAGDVCLVVEWSAGRVDWAETLDPVMQRHGGSEECQEIAGKPTASFS